MGRLPRRRLRRGKSSGLAGKVRSIGVSNFLQADLDNITKHGTVIPHVNQILVHAGNTPAELIAYCEEKNILIEAYSPIAHGEILKNKDVAAIADKYGVSVATRHSTHG